MSYFFPLLKMISEITFEQIEGNFWYAAYGPFRVIMMKDTGYINATKMCRSGGKEYKDWIRLKGSHELIQALERSMALENRHGTSASTLQGTSEQICSEVSPPCIFVKTGNIAPTEQLISGTYCHPDLVPHITCWVSADFVLKLLMATSLRSTKTNSALCSYNLSRLPNYVKRLFPTC